MSLASRRIHGWQEQDDPPPPPSVHLSTGGARGVVAGGAFAFLLLSPSVLSFRAKGWWLVTGADARRCRSSCIALNVALPQPNESVASNLHVASAGEKTAKVNSRSLYRPYLGPSADSLRKQLSFLLKFYSVDKGSPNREPAGLPRGGFFTS
jgi:hypothetical protein